MRPETTPPTKTAADTRAEQHSEARDFRSRSTVLKLKKLRRDSSDLTDLGAVWATIDALPE